MKHNYTPALTRLQSCSAGALSLLGAFMLSSTCFASVAPDSRKAPAAYASASFTESYAMLSRTVERPGYAVAGRPQGNASSDARPDPHQLLDASLRGDLRLVQELVRQKVNIQFANEDGERALHMAASRGHLSVVIFLLNNGANMNARTIKNWIPLHHAIRFNHPVVANYLLAKGAPPYFRTTDGVNSLEIAETMRNQRMISLVMNYM